MKVLFDSVCLRKLHIWDLVINAVATMTRIFASTMDKIKCLTTERSQVSDEVNSSLEVVRQWTCQWSKLTWTNFRIKLRGVKLDEDIKPELFSQPSTKEEDLEAEFDSRETYRDTLSTLRAKYEHLIVDVCLQSKASNENGESNTNPSKKCFHLPKLQQNQFDGNFKIG